MKFQILQYIVVNQKQSKRGDVFDEENVEESDEEEERVGDIRLEGEIE